MPIKGITFISSELCNLNCKYCYIANSKSEEHDYYLKVHNEITKSLEDKSYINNYLTCLNRLKIDPKAIEYVSLWGQEPTINLEKFFLNFDYLAKKFPNIHQLMFSTNGVSNIHKILDAIQIVDNVMAKPFHFHV
jgi:sulfatase maturation enzyme AslB (radical SAM superfamily)